MSINSRSSHSVQKGAIAGIVIGVLSLITFAGISAFLVFRKMRKRMHTAQKTDIASWTSFERPQSVRKPPVPQALMNSLSAMTPTFARPFTLFVPRTPRTPGPRSAFPQTPASRSTMPQTPRVPPPSYMPSSTSVPVAGSSSQVVSLPPRNQRRGEPPSYVESMMVSGSDQAQVGTLADLSQERESRERETRRELPVPSALMDIKVPV